MVQTSGWIHAGYSLHWGLKMKRETEVISTLRAEWRPLGLMKERNGVS